MVESLERSRKKQTESQAGASPKRSWRGGQLNLNLKWIPTGNQWRHLNYDRASLGMTARRQQSSGDASVCRVMGSPQERDLKWSKRSSAWIRISAEMKSQQKLWTMLKELMSRLAHYWFNIYHEQVECTSGNFSHSQIHHTQIRVTSRGGFSVRSRALLTQGILRDLR